MPEGIGSQWTLEIAIQYSGILQYFSTEEVHQSLELQSGCNRKVI